MNKTNIKRVKTIGLILITLIILIGCKNSANKEKKANIFIDYNYVLFNVNGVECRLKYRSHKISPYGENNCYKLADGTYIFVSNDSGRLNAYDDESVIMAEVMEQVEKKLDTPILKID